MIYQASVWINKVPLYIGSCRIVVGKSRVELKLRKMSVRCWHSIKKRKGKASINGNFFFYLSFNYFNYTVFAGNEEWKLFLFCVYFFVFYSFSWTSTAIALFFDKLYTSCNTFSYTSSILEPFKATCFISLYTESWFFNLKL